MTVAQQLTASGPLDAHLRDELGIDREALARPLQAAWTSATSFALFATVPIASLLIAPSSLGEPVIAVVSLATLAVLGAMGGYLGGAPRLRAALRVTIGGGLAMAVSAGIGRLLGVAVG